MSFGDPLTARIATFLRGIGLEVRAGTVGSGTALPGIDIEHGALVVDASRLAHPGDLLHEAGHLAVVPPAQRAAFHHDVGDDAADEMAAIAWSYAAALHLGIDPARVFHPDGYRGGSAAILENFAAGRYFGVPMLQYCGLTFEQTPRRPAPQGVAPYPAMQRWLRA